MTEDSPDRPLPFEAAAFLENLLGPGWTATALHGDASVRAYYRVQTPGEGRLMLAYYPAEIRDGVQRFVSAYQAIHRHAKVPDIVRHSDFAIAQHDVGDQTLFDLLRDDRERALHFYRAAIDLIAGFQQAPVEAQQINPPFDTQKFFDELEMTREYYVSQLAGETDQAKHRELQSLFRIIAEKITSHPYLLCHRDYHGQNLHILNDVLYMIDYQDLRLGPDTYDLASLLRDRGAWTILGADAELELVDRYAELITAPGDVRRRYFETLLQRSIKAIGTFARQAVTRGRRHYLDYIPTTFESVRHCVAELPEFRPLLEVFPPAS